MNRTPLVITCVFALAMPHLLHADEVISLDLGGGKQQSISVKKVDQKLKFELQNALLTSEYEISIGSVTEDSKPPSKAPTPCQPLSALQGPRSEELFKEQFSISMRQAVDYGPDCVKSIEPLNKRALTSTCPNVSSCKTISVSRKQSGPAWTFALSEALDELEIDAFNLAQDFEIEPNQLYRVAVKNVENIAIRNADSQKCGSAITNVSRAVLDEFGVSCTGNKRNPTTAYIRLLPGDSVRLVATGTRIDRGLFKNKRIFRLSSGSGEVSRQDLTDLQFELKTIKAQRKNEPLTLEWARNLETGLESFTEEYDGNRSFRGTVKLGFNGDETSRDINLAAAGNKFKLDLGFDLGRGKYPNQFAVKSQFAVTSSDDKRLEDSVTSVSFKYDYYFKPWLEVFGFLQRTSNTFLSIEERYEAGTGVKFEYNVGWLTRTGHDKAKEISKLENACEQEHAACTKSMKKLLAKLPGDQMTQLLRHLYTSLEYGLLFGVFAELEDPAELALNVRNVSTDTETELARTPESLRRFRVEARPSFTWRPNNQITFEGGIYYKWALDKPIRPYDDDSEICKDSDLVELCSRSRDTHRHGFLDITYKIDDTGTTTLTLGLDWYFDSTPPRYVFSDTELDDLSAPMGLDVCPNLTGNPVSGVVTCIPKVIFAEGNHRNITFTVNRTFK